MTAGLPKQFTFVESVREMASPLIAALFPQNACRQPMLLPLKVQRVPLHYSPARRQKSRTPYFQ